MTLERTDCGSLLMTAKGGSIAIVITMLWVFGGLIRMKLLLHPLGETDTPYFLDCRRGAARTSVDSVPG